MVTLVPWRDFVPAVPEWYGCLVSDSSKTYASALWSTNLVAES